MPEKESVKLELTREDMAVLQNALFDYENYLNISPAGRRRAVWVRNDVARIRQMREAISQLQANPDSMPLLIDARPPDWLAESRHI